MIHQKDGVPIGDEVVHDPSQAGDIGGMQADRGFIQDI